MKKLFFQLIVALTLVSCGAPDGKFRVEGRFRNLNQGDFYFCNIHRGTIDTVHVRDGRFAYETEAADTTVITLLFPNFSELPVIVQPGAKVSIMGDVSHLRTTQVRGSKANEELTAFRLMVADMPVGQAKDEAKKFIEAHPDAPGSTYLLQQYFLRGYPDYKEAHRLARLVAQAQPDDIYLQRLLTQLKTLSSALTGQQLPRFKATDTKHRTVDNSVMKADVNVICTWASWNSESQNMMHELAQLKKSKRGRLSVVSFCLDATEREGQYTLKRDSISWHNVCSGQLWQEPALSQLGLTTVPANIVADATGKIIARDLSTRELRDRIEKLLKN